MKIAILISGAPRTMVFDEFITYYENFINNFKKNNIEYDVFMLLKLNEHISETPIETKAKHYKNFLDKESKNYFASKKGIDNFKKILDILNPSFIHGFNIFEKDNSCYYSQIKMIDILIEKAMKSETESKIKYDFFIRIRPELILLDDINLQTLNKNLIYTGFKKDTIGSDMIFIFGQNMLYNWWLKYIRTSFNNVLLHHERTKTRILPDFFIFNNVKNNVIQKYELALVRDFEALQGWNKDLLGKKINLYNFWGEKSEYLKLHDYYPNFLEDFKNILKKYKGHYYESL